MEQKYDFEYKTRLLLQLGEHHSRPNADLNVLLIKEPQGRNKFLFSELGPSFRVKWDKTFPTNDSKILSFKGAVLLETLDELNGGISTGSTTVTAYICQRIIALGLDTDELMNFVLSNKSSNPYTPFGQRAASNFTDYQQFKDFEKNEKLRKFRHAEELLQSAEKKKLLKKKRSQEHKNKLYKKIEENNKKYDLVKTYFSDTENQLLNDLLQQNLPFPIFMIPKNELEKLTKRINELDISILDKLIENIPKKSPEHIREFRKKVRQQRIKLI